MIKIDVPRAQKVATLLLNAYRKDGVFGVKQGEMPDNTPPAGADAGDKNHLRLIMLTVALDYQRDHDQLWEAARRSYADERTHYLFDPHAVALCPYEKIFADMRLHGLSRKPDKDAGIWQRIATTLAGHFDGQVVKLIERADNDALLLLKLLKNPQLDFPSLKGPKISRLWIKILTDNMPGGLGRLELVDVPVDIHTAQATVQTGCAEPDAIGKISGQLRAAIQQVWREAAAGLGIGFHPLAIEEPLWVLSRKGCRRTSTWPCEHRDRCPVAAHCLTRQVRLPS